MLLTVPVSVKQEEFWKSIIQMVIIVNSNVLHTLKKMLRK